MPDPITPVAPTPTPSPGTTPTPGVPNPQDLSPGPVIRGAQANQGGEMPWDTMGRELFSQGSGSVFGGVPVLGDLGRWSGEAFKAAGGGVGDVMGATADLMRAIPGTQNWGSADQLTSYGLGHDLNSKINWQDTTRYSPNANGAINLIEDLKKENGQTNLARQFLTLGQWQQVNDPTAFADWQKTLAEAQKHAGAQGAEAISRYLRQAAVDYYDQTPQGYQGWLDVHPELAFGGEPTLGMGFADDLARIFTAQAHAERGAAALSGSKAGLQMPWDMKHYYWSQDGVVQRDMGSRLNQMMSLFYNDPKSLTPVETATVKGILDLGWTDAHAYNFLIDHASGYSSSAISQIGVGLALDPVGIATMGAALGAEVGNAAIHYGEGVQATSRLGRLAQWSTAGRLNKLSDVLTRSIGTTVKAVRADPVLGRAMKVARTVIDPISGFPSGAAGNATKDVYAATGLEALRRGFGPAAITNMARRASRLGFRAAFDNALGNSAMNWMRSFTGSEIVDGLTSFDATGARRIISENELLSKGRRMAKDAATRGAAFIHARRAFYLTRGAKNQLAERLAKAFDMQIEDARAMVKDMPADEQALAHDLSYRQAWRNWEEVKNTVDPAEIDTQLAKRWEDLVPQNPRELNNLQAQKIIEDVRAAKGDKAKIAVWNQATEDFETVNGIGRVDMGGINMLKKQVEKLQAIIDQGSLPASLTEKEIEALPKVIQEQFLARWVDSAGDPIWNLGFKPRAEQATGLVYKTTRNGTSLIHVFDPSIENVSDVISPIKRSQPITDALGRAFGNTPLAKVKDSMEVAVQVAKDRVGGDRIMTAMEQDFRRRVRGMGVPDKVARQAFRLARDKAGESGFTLAGMSPEEFWGATKPVLKDWVDAKIGKQEVFTAMMQSAGGDMRLLGVSAGMAQKLRAGLTARGLNPNNYLGAVSVKTYNMMRYALNPTFFLQAVFDAPWFNMYRGVMFDLMGRTPKVGSDVYEMQRITNALAHSGLHRALSMDYTERIATIGFQEALRDNLGALPGVEKGVGDRLKRWAGQMILNNEMLYMNNGIGDVVYRAIETTANALDEKIANAATDAERAVWQAQRNDPLIMMQWYEDRLAQTLGHVPTREEVGRAYLTDIISDSRLEQRTPEMMLDFRDAHSKAVYSTPVSAGKIEPIDALFGVNELRWPNIHNLEDLKQAIRRETYSWGDVKDRLLAEGYHPDAVSRFVSQASFDWRTYFDGVRRELGMSSYEMQRIEDYVAQTARAVGMDPADYLTQVMPFTARDLRGEAQATQYASQGRVVAPEELKQLRREGKALYQSMSDNSAPLKAWTRAPRKVAKDLYDRTIKGGTVKASSLPRGENRMPPPRPSTPRFEGTIDEQSAQLREWNMQKRAQAKSYASPDLLAAVGERAGGEPVLDYAANGGFSASRPVTSGRSIAGFGMTPDGALRDLARRLDAETGAMEWGGATWDPRTGKYLEAQPYIYHGTSGRFGESIKASGITRGDWVTDPTSKMIPGENMYGKNAVLYRTKSGNLVGSTQKAEGWVSGGRAAAKDLEVSTNGGKTWTAVGKTAPETGPWATSVTKKTVSLSYEDAANPAKFEAALKQFMQENADALQRDGHYVGVFNDTATGKVEFDVNVVTHTARDTEAMQAAFKRTGGAYDFTTGNGLFAPRSAAKADPLAGVTEEMRFVLKTLRTASRGEKGLEDAARLVAGHLQPSMKARLLEHFLEDLTGSNGLIEQALARGDAATAQELNKIVESLSGGWGPEATRMYKDLLIQRLGGQQVKSTGAVVEALDRVKAAKPLDQAIVGWNDQVEEGFRRAGVLDRPDRAGTVYSNGKGLLYAYDDHGRLVGHMGYTASPGSYGVMNVITRPGFERQGVATRLYDAALAEKGSDFLKAIGQTGMSPSGKAFTRSWLQRLPTKATAAFTDVEGMPGVQRVPISKIEPFVEVDRNAVAKGGGLSTDLENLTRDIEANGIKEPLTLEYDNATGTAILSDGNHRFAAAKAAGLEEVPVQVVPAKRTPLEAADMTQPPKGFVPTEARPHDATRPSDLFNASRMPSDAEVERGLRYFKVWLEHTNPTMQLGEALKGFVDQLPAEGGTPYHFTQSVLMSTLRENLDMLNRDAIRLAHMQTDRTVLERSLNHPFFAMYPTSYFWGKVVPETLRFVGYKPFGVQTGLGAETYYRVKQNIALQQMYDDNMGSLWDKVGKSAVMGFFSYASPSLPYEDMRINLPPWVRALGQGNFDKMLTSEFDTFSPDRWVKRIMEAGHEVAGGVGAMIDTLPSQQKQGLEQIAQGGGSAAPATAPTADLSQPVQATGLQPILTADFAELQKALMGK